MYLFNPSILNRIQPRPTSIEKEIFPNMAKEGQLFCMTLKGFWMDIGQPKDFLEGTKLYLTNLAQNGDPKTLLTKSKSIHGAVIIDSSTKIGENCEIGPNVTIGPGCVIGNGVRLRNSVILQNSKIGDNSWIDQSIIGWEAKIGRWVRIQDVSVLGKDVTVEDELFINGGKILPHKSISTSVLEPSIIM